MSDQEKKSGSSGTGSTPVVVVSQTSDNRQKQPYRSTELQEETTELHHKRSRAPGVPSVVEELKDVSEDSNGSSVGDNKDRKDRAPAQDALKQKQSLAKKLSSKYNKTEHLDYETITLAPLTVETKADPVLVTTKPSLGAAKASNVIEKSDDQKAEEDSITDEVTELRTPETTKKQLEWSDDEEAGGLPRSESRASRLSRTMRQLFCCGVTYEAASEDNETTKHCYHLERKASVGPCYRPRTPFERPSGITICLPKKSTGEIPSQTGININIPRKLTPRQSMIFEMKECGDSSNKGS